MNLEEKIREYVKSHKNNYALECNLRKFLDANPDVEEYAEKMLESEPWFKTVANVLSMVSKGIFSKQYCKTCGKELSVESCKRGNIYCCSGCKSKDASRKDSDNQIRIEREKIYEVDLSVPVSDDIVEFFNANGSKPSKEVLDKIMDFNKKDSKGNGLFHLLNDNKDVDSYLTTLVRVHPWMEDKKRAYWYVKNGLYEGKRCKVCGKLLTFYQLKGNHEYCSDKCSNNSLEIRAKIENTCKERYGGTNPMHSEDIRNRLKNRLVEKYGVENASQVEEFKEKRKATTLERFGTEYYLASKDCREKTKATSLEKYGVNHPMKSEAVKKRQKESFLQKYGVDNASKTDEVKKKISKVTRASRYRRIVEHYSDFVVPLFTEEEYVKVQNTKCMWKCVKCGTEFEDHRHGTNCGYRRGSSFPLCPTCHPPISGTSNGEQEVVDFVKSIYSGNVFENSRNVIPPLEVDIWIPEKNVAIEYNGLYWHSEAAGKGETYHLRKTEKCNKVGVRLVHIFEDEWNESKEIVKDRIRNILGLTGKRIFARKCVVKLIDYYEANEFLDLFHLQGGNTSSSWHYGLYYNDELVSVMTFGKPRFNKNYNWELIRFASKIGFSVVGGASKLLAHFRKEHSGSIVSYADRRYSDGNLYEKLGFARSGSSKPNYWYVKGNEKLSRYECQKHKLPELLGSSYDERFSEYDNMIMNGWSKVHDCGNYVYVLE